MNEPVTFSCAGFQEAWVAVARHLASSNWETYNVVVHIRDTTLLDQDLHAAIEVFAEEAGILGPKHVAYTIFPHNLYRMRGSAERLYQAYNRIGGLYEFTQKKAKRWGTYFRRMIKYEKEGGAVNQLQNIISAIRSRTRLYRAAYTIVTQYPGEEMVRRLGSPCLNYIAVQLSPGSPALVGLMAVYRNHDFLTRAYGNYWGLCNLVHFFANETGLNPGPLTCISSHAFVDRERTLLRQFLEEI
jgi:thymidylate synthase